jgi:hypothetical protein
VKGQNAGKDIMTEHQLFISRDARKGRSYERENDEYYLHARTGNKIWCIEPTKPFLHRPIPSLHMEFLNAPDC